MNWNEEKQKFENLTEEEQRLADTMFNKGFSQAAKKSQPEVAQNTITPEQIETLLAQAVSKAITPLQQELEITKKQSEEAKKTNFLAQQETKLPAVYAALVTGSNESEWQNSFKTVEEQFKQDLKATGITANFGAPTPNKSPEIKLTKNFKEMTPAEKIELCKKDPDLYSRLKNN